jgi:hypothetical protein
MVCLDGEGKTVCIDGEGKTVCKNAHTMFSCSKPAMFCHSTPALSQRLSTRRAF